MEIYITTKIAAVDPRAIFYIRSRSVWTPLSFIFLFFNFIFFLNFTILYWFCHTSKWIRHRHTCVPHPEPPSLLPPHTIPLGRPSALAPSIQYRASKLDWHLLSYMILNMFQCHSLGFVQVTSFLPMSTSVYLSFWVLCISTAGEYFLSHPVAPWSILRI